MNTEFFALILRSAGILALLILSFAAIEQTYNFFQARGETGGWELFWKHSRRRRTEAYERAMIALGNQRKRWLEENPYASRSDAEYQALVLSEIGATDLYFASLDGTERKRGFYHSCYEQLLRELV